MLRNYFRSDFDFANLYDFVVNWFTYYVGVFVYAALYASMWYFQLEGAFWVTIFTLAFLPLTAIVACLLYMAGGFLTFLWVLLCMDMHSPEET